MFVVTRQIVSVKGPWLKCHVFIVPVSRPRASEHRLTSHKLHSINLNFRVRVRAPEYKCNKRIGIMIITTNYACVQNINIALHCYTADMNDKVSSVVSVTAIELVCLTVSNT